MLFGIGSIKPVFILYVNHLAGAKYLSHQEAACIGTLRWNAADWRIRFPQLVRRHSLANHCAALNQVMRQGTEAFGLNKRNAVLGQEIMQHLRVLPRHGRAEYSKNSGRKAKING